MDVLELDVRITADQRIVLAHDPDIVGPDGCAPHPIAHTDFDDLPLFMGHRLCLLEELLDAIPDAAISLDFKVHRDSVLIDRVYAMFNERKRTEKLVWGSFDESTRKLCVAQHPDVATFFSLFGTVRVLFLYLLGVLPFYRFEERLLCNVLITEKFTQSLLDRLQTARFSRTASLLRWIGPARICRFLGWIIESPAFVEHMHSRGVAVSFWTVNDDDDLRRVRRTGSRSIITDYPSRRLHRKA